MNLDKELLKEKLKNMVDENRYLHSLGVADMAKNLAVKYGEDPDRAEIAGILHDYTKSWPNEKLVEYIKNYNELSKDLLLYGEKLWHGSVSSIVVQEEFNIDDEDIINSIRYHTSGRVKMSLLEKIICLADYIEPTRKYDGVDYIRLIANENLNKALLAALDGTIIHLINNGEIVYPLTLEARNYLVDEIKQLEGGN